MESNHVSDMPGHDMIEVALDSMVSIAMYINEMKRKHEMLTRIQELQSLVTGRPHIDLALFGDLVLEVCVSLHLSLAALVQWLWAVDGWRFVWDIVHFVVH